MRQAEDSQTGRLGGVVMTLDVGDVAALVQMVVDSRCAVGQGLDECVVGARVPAGEWVLGRCRHGDERQRDDFEHSPHAASVRSDEAAERMTVVRPRCVSGALGQHDRFDR